MSGFCAAGSRGFGDRAAGAAGKGASLIVGLVRSGATVRGLFSGGVFGFAGTIFGRSGAGAKSSSGGAGFCGSGRRGRRRGAISSDFRRGFRLGSLRRRRPAGQHRYLARDRAARTKVIFAPERLSGSRRR